MAAHNLPQHGANRARQDVARKLGSLQTANCMGEMSGSVYAANVALVDEKQGERDHSMATGVHSVDLAAAVSLKWIALAFVLSHSCHKGTFAYSTASTSPITHAPREHEHALAAAVLDLAQLHVKHLDLLG